MDVHPTDGEEMLLAQFPITEHFFAQMAQLDVECAVLQPTGQLVYHHTEILGTTAIVAIDAYVGVEIGGKPRPAEAHDGQHVSHNRAMIVSNYRHIRFEARRLFAQRHKLATMEKVSCRKLG